MAAVRVFHRVALPLLMIAVIAGLLAMTLRSPVFQLARLTARGGPSSDPLVLGSLSGLFGTHVLTFRESRIRKLLGSNSPGSAPSVSRLLPDEMSITWRAREPWAIWRTPNDQYVVDDAGLILGKELPSGQNLLVIRQVGTGEPPGDRFDPEVISLIHDLQERLPQRVGAKPRWLDYHPTQGLTVTVDQGWQARFGERDTDLQLHALQRILETTRKAQKPVKFVDLRFSNTAYFR
jgi:cell division septal protein FtsQ